MYAHIILNISPGIFSTQTAYQAAVLLSTNSHLEGGWGEWMWGKEVEGGWLRNGCICACVRIHATWLMASSGWDFMQFQISLYGWREERDSSYSHRVEVWRTWRSVAVIGGLIQSVSFLCHWMRSAHAQLTQLCMCAFTRSRNFHLPPPPPQHTHVHTELRGRSSKTKVYINKMSSCECQRPYHAESTGSRPITEVKQRRARLVLGWVTAWEHRVLLAISFFFFFLFFFFLMKLRHSHLSYSQHWHCFSDPFQ